MPKESVTSLKQQNQDLKDKVDALWKEIKQLKEKVRVDSAITFGAEAAVTSGNSNNNASNDETVSRSLQYLSDEYDDLSASNSGVVDQLKALSRRLNKLSAEVTRVGNAIDEVEEYSYQFNVKIIGLPEKSSETAAETSALCVKLFQEMGAEVFLSDIDIAHRVPSRQQNGAPKPIICKFVRRLACRKQVSWKLDKVPLKSTHQISVCLLIVFLTESESLITSPPKNNTCYLKIRDLKNRTSPIPFLLGQEFHDLFTQE